MSVDPQVQTFLDLQAQNEVPPISEQTPAMAREGYEAFAGILGEGEEVGRVEDRTIPGLGSTIPVRIYTPKEDGPFGILVYYHGGGWVMGSLDTHDHVCRSLCSGSSCVVVSVEYRLAPEHPFPAALKDAWDALLWVAENARLLGGEPGRLAVGGDSAGGNLAAIVSLRSRDAGGPTISFQLLVYPAVDLRMGHPSIDENAEGFVLTKEHMLWFRDHYLPDVDAYTDSEISPLLAKSHLDLPPACIFTAEFDPLRDEGEEYGEKLRAAGVEVEVERFDGMVHIFFQLAPLVDEARRAVEKACSTLRSALAVTR